MNIALSGNEIMDALDGRVKLLSYDELQKYNSIDEAMYPYNKMALLYFWEFKNNVKKGHWVGVKKNKLTNTIYVMDSYGRFIDDNLKEIDDYTRKKFNEYHKQLTYLLYISHYKVEYNENKIQQDSSAVCGRYVLYFLLRDDLDIDKFQKLFGKNYKKNDKLIIELTNKYI